MKKKLSALALAASLLVGGAVLPADAANAQYLPGVSQRCQQDNFIRWAIKVPLKNCSTANPRVGVYVGWNGGHHPLV